MKKRWGLGALLAVASLGFGASADAQCSEAACNALVGGCDNVIICPSGGGFCGPSTPLNDCYIGSDEADVILDFVGGNDCVCGGGGDDIIELGDGADVAFGDGGSDEIDVGEGNDLVFAGDGNDEVFGQGGEDRIFGDDGDDTIDGGDEADDITGGIGNDTIDGGNGDDDISGGEGADQISGGSGIDDISGGDGDDTINGDGDNDVLTGGAGADTIDGGLGNDEISGQSGADILRGDEGDDTIFGGTENDQLFGGNGADRLSGEDGDDTLEGEGDGDLQLDGGPGDDTINGGPGADTANGGSGFDFINGGDGDDTLSGGDDPDVISGGEGNDTIRGNGGNDNLDGNGGTNDQVFGDAGENDICRNFAVTDGTCELNTPAVVASFSAFDDGSSIVVRWVTSSEIQTAGFRLYRERDGEWIELHDALLPALLSSPQGGTYDFRDDADPEAPLRYRLVDVSPHGVETTHGPFEVVVESTGQSLLEDDGVYARAPHATTPAAFATKGGSLERQRLGEPIAIYLGVEETGLYTIGASEIAVRLGVDDQDVLDRIAAGQLSLTEQGEPVAWYAGDDGASLLFYGTFRKSLYTPERIYRLALAEGDVMGARSAAPGPLAPDLTYEGMVHLERDEIPGILVADDPESDYWFWQLVSASPSLPGTAEVTFRLESVAGDGTLSVELHGVTDESHEVDVRLNGALLGTAAFEGVVRFTTSFPIAESALLDGDNTLTIAHGSSSESMVYLNFADLQYTRTYDTSAPELEFTSTEDASLEVTGLVGDDLDLLDVSDPRQPVRLTGAESTPSGLRLATAPSETYFAASRSGARSPSSIWNDVASDLRSSDNAAEYVVIAPASLLEGAEALAEYREDDGLLTRVVELQDIFDEFAFGAPDPNAIRAFLRHAQDTWSTAPELVALIGKGSYDYRDLLGEGGNLLPPIMAFTRGGILSADTRYADLVGDDGFPDLSIGRLPVKSAEELDSVLSQIRDYEERLDDLRNDVALLADDTTPEADFGGMSDDAAMVLPPDWSVAPIYRSELGDLESTRAVLFDEIQKGPRVLGYLGHAGLTALGLNERLFDIDDVDSLTIDGAQPIFADMTCVASRFAVPGFVSLGETMFIDEDGAVAVWGATGLSINEQASVLLEALLAELSSEREARLGPMIDRAFGALDGLEGSRQMFELYHLFGDPALRMNKQADIPGTGGSGGNGGSGGSGGTTPGTGGTVTPSPGLVMAGCSTSRDASSGSLIALLGLAAFALRRRRPR